MCEASAMHEISHHFLGDFADGLSKEREISTRVRGPPCACSRQPANRTYKGVRPAVAHLLQAFLYDVLRVVRPPGQTGDDFLWWRGKLGVHGTAPSKESAEDVCCEIAPPKACAEDRSAAKGRTCGATVQAGAG